MAYVVTQNCCNDATCVAVCPVDCIHPTPDEAGYAAAEMLYINPSTCIDCGACADVCPVDAIVPVDALALENKRYREINADYFARNPQPARPVFARAEPTASGNSAASAGAPAIEPLRVAIVGSGPAAFYAAEELLARRDVVAEVTMIERLPAAGGLVRFGVAPDHWHTKLMGRVFDRTTRRTGFSLYLGVEVGRDITQGELLEHHHAVLYASGAPDDRRLGIPGEDLPGSHSASEFVAWYNGHPEKADAVFDLSASRAVVVGNGNVALDVARVLVTDPKALAGTDIADHALHALTDGAVREVVVLGRRRPASAAFTTPELLALGSVPGVDVVVEGAVAISPNATIKEVILAEYSQARPLAGNKRIVLRFDTVPVEIAGDGRVKSVRVTDPTGHAKDTIDCGLVFRAIGYRGCPLPDLPFDECTGTVPNVGGRVMDPHLEGRLIGCYVAGWIKRGPSGVIGTNRYCAAETVMAIAADHRAGALPSPTADGSSLSALIRRRQPGALDIEAWRAVDRYERMVGRRQNRPRVKVIDRWDGHRAR